jgi:1,4-dihydroxy-6-naphthoate synthase
MRTISIAISPCPNDTFIFENICTGKYTLPDTEFDFTFLDIQELNNAASKQTYDFVKISFAHLRGVQENYTLLTSGGAMGYGVGPVLVKKKVKQLEDDINASTCSVAIPGRSTTANMLFSYFYPYIAKQQKQEVLFSDIEEWILAGKNRMGVLIHEGRFTYEEKGLELVCDLGALWQQKLNLPVPLGCIGSELLTAMELLIADSITNYDLNGHPIISAFIKQHAQAMNERVIRQHIDLYVNDFSKNMGQSAVAAMTHMESISVEW